MTILLDFIKSSPYFTGLEEIEFDSVRKLLFEKKADRGEIILFEGEPAENLYFVVSGVVKFFRTSPDGKEQILNIVRPGESFNDVPVAAGGFNIASAEAMGAVVLYVLRKSDLDVFLHEHPQVATNLISVLSLRIEQLVSLVEDLSFRQVTGRVAKILLEYAGDSDGERPRLTQQEMAAMIGTAREMVGRSLKTLEEDGKIRLDRHRIVITNLKALRETAGVT